jgi:predicted NodU family carbamoyl transferase
MFSWIDTIVVLIVNFIWSILNKKSSGRRKFKTLNRILKDQNYGNPYIDYFHEYLSNNFDPKKDAEDLSAAIQYITEEVATDYISHFRKKYPNNNILLAGGVFANVKVKGLDINAETSLDGAFEFNLLEKLSGDI